MATISSSSLFHFTRNFDYLKNIIQRDFRPRYYPEILKLGDKKITKAIPMVCFCDLPLSMVKNHMNTYGNYGIGLKKSWAERKGLNPVLYVAQNSKVGIYLQTIIDDFKNHGEINNHRNANWNFLKILRHLKNYQGQFKRDGKIINKIKFYDEREWRYTPINTEENRFWLNEEEFFNEGILEKENKIIGAEKYKLTFEPNDISYIIVESEDDIQSCINAIQSLKSNQPYEQVQKLVTRIITAEQIKNDF